MKLCFPVQSDEGLSSKVYHHFGSTPLFIVHDTQDETTTILENGDLHHAHGSCDPLRALGGQAIDAVVVAGIGAGAVHRLNRLGITVYRASVPTIAENLILLKAGQLPLLRPEQCCGGHSQGGGCAH